MAIDYLGDMFNIDDQYTEEEIDAMCDNLNKSNTEKTLSSQVQTFGSYNDEDGYSFSIGFGNGPVMTLEGLTKEDIYEIASCACCMLPEEDYQTLINS